MVLCCVYRSVRLVFGAAAEAMRVLMALLWRGVLQVGKLCCSHLLVRVQVSGCVLVAAMVLT
jgi:hypothetical protein